MTRRALPCRRTTATCGTDVASARGGRLAAHENHGQSSGCHAMPRPDQPRSDQYSVRNTAAIADLSYLTYLPLPLSTSWYLSQKRI